MQRRRFGAHLTTVDGIRYAAVNARALGVEAMQIMVGEGFSWSPFKMSDSTINEFRKLAYGIAVYVHLPYTINPCVGKGHAHHSAQKSVMRKYMDVCDAIGATAAVLHPGYKKELSEDASRANFVKFMEDIAPNLPPVKILFENDAGSKNGSKIGSPEFIEYALARLPRSNYGMCIDTEHLWARGINLWDDEIRTEFLTRYDKLIELVHLNAPDEGVELGSFIDRHSVELGGFKLDSAKMATEIVKRYPAVLERKSLVVIERDVNYINGLVPAVGRGMELGKETEDHPNDPTIDGTDD